METRIWSEEGKAVRWVTAAVFALSFCFSFGIYSNLYLLYDTDSYFHLAVARLYGQEGIPQTLDWARFSVMHRGYGDKELLFHILLAPLATWIDPELGGRLGLALLNAAIAASIAYMGIRAVGLAGLLAPVFTFCLSGAFAVRMIRLRPELLALLLFMWAVWAASRQRWRTLGVIAFFFALSYTAFQALFGLCVIWFAWEWWASGRWRWRLLLYPAVGLLAGLALHPHFPDNLYIWMLQNVEFFRAKQVLQVGAEFKAFTTEQILTLNAGLIASFPVLWWSRTPLPPSGESEFEDSASARTAAYFWLAALPFAFLFVLMSRFATFFVPLATLGLLWEIRRRGFRIGSEVRLPGGRQARLSVVLSACMLGCIPVGQTLFGIFASNGGILDTARNNLRELGRKIPPGAAVAAPWDMTGDYVFWAPRASYLNVLDPVFMAVADPHRHRAQSELFYGDAPDAPLSVKLDLQSDYLAFSRPRTARLDQRLQNDPRAQSMVRGQQLLYRIRDDANGAFVLDWKVRTGGDGGVSRGETVYPRHGTAAGRRVEGFVDASRLAVRRPCDLFFNDLELALPTVVLYEFAPYGPGSLWIDGVQRAKIASPAKAILGKGVGLPVRFDAGAHRVAVRTCYSDNRSGFYLLRRDQSR